MSLPLILQRKKNKIRRSKADLSFDIVNFVIIGIFILLIIFPLMNLVALAFSHGSKNPTITFLPQSLTLRSFSYVFTERAFLKSVLNSVIITATVTIGSNLLMALAAYPLSKRDCPFKMFFMIFFVITMLFSAGIVPSYFLLEIMGLTNKIAGVIAISLLNVFNMLLFKTFFEGIPDEIEEAARIDGAGGMNLFIKIVIPMSTPIIASCCFFTLVGAWNNYGTALIYISKAEAYPLALYIYKLINSTEATQDDFLITFGPNIRAAAIVVSIIPIILIYPYVIRYIKGGITVGSVKG